MHQPLIGEGAVTARVTSLVLTHPSDDGQPEPGGPSWAKAGLLVEPRTSPGTLYAAVMVTGGYGVRMQYDYTHDTAGLSGPVGPSSPRWLRLTRAGDLVTAYDSANGAQWAKVGTARLPGSPATVEIGLFVTSPVYFGPGANGFSSDATARFDHVSAEGDLPRPTWTGEPVGAGDLYPYGPGTSAWHAGAGGVFTVSGSGDIAPLVEGGTFDDPAGSSILVGAVGGLLFLVVLATLFITSEYRRGLICTTFTATPGRGRVLAAKAIVVGTVASRREPLAPPSPSSCAGTSSPPMATTCSR